VLDLGTLARSQSIQLAYFLDYADASAKAGGFGFGYGLVDGPSAAIPEPSTWTMMLIGFTGLAWVGRRASRRAVAGAVQCSAIFDAKTQPLRRVFSFRDAQSPDRLLAEKAAPSRYRDSGADHYLLTTAT
jgi:PEP-CTERM motif